MTMKIAIGLSFYQDYSSLERMYNSLRPYPIDLIIAIDGKYKEWPNPTDPDLSNAKEFLDIFRSGDIPFRYIDAIGLTQIEKRNLYFDYCNKENIDVLIVMDSDEFIVQDKTDWPLFIQDLEEKIRTRYSSNQIQSYCIPVRGYNIQGNSAKTDSELSPIANVIRVFYRPGELEYYGNHYTIRNNHTKIVQNYQAGTTNCSHVMIGHDHALRSPEYLEQNHEYQKTQTKHEKEGRYLLNHK